jgi:urea carboxylase
MVVTSFAVIVTPGVQTTVQDLPGRTGFWSVGVPPSGAWDSVSLTLANTAVGNRPGAAGIEAVLRGPKMRFTAPATIAVTGAATSATLDGVALAPGVPVEAGPGQVLDMGPFGGPGVRGYLAVRGGIAVDTVMGSASTFLLGRFGGYGGRALAAGDTLDAGTTTAGDPGPVTDDLPRLAHDWDLRVVPGPHGAHEHLSGDGVTAFFGATWTVDHRADRTGIRLLGPAPGWARDDGGDAGLHPSNIHDSAYPVGAIMIAGDVPVIVGPDGPSLGGFVVAATVVGADQWMLGQLRPGDRVRLRPVDRRTLAPAADTAPDPLVDIAATPTAPALTARPAGDTHLLVEAGPLALDLDIRLRIHLLASRLLAECSGIAEGAGIVTGAGIVECVEGVRSVLIKVDPGRLSLEDLAAAVAVVWAGLPDPRTVTISSREVTMPIAFDDPAAHEAMARYASGVRPDAPWCPDNVEFIRRINGLDDRPDVFATVEAASYLVVGLGDVYLGAPVAVPLDPLHRLVTTKYDPPRTWTPANAVGIGGVYLCVYGMEGPGGYQLVGRTVPVWRTPAADRPGAPRPWLLRPFDVLRFRAVSPTELAEARAGIAEGRADLETRPITLTYGDIVGESVSPGAVAFTATRSAAYRAERDRWQLADVLA